MKRLCGGVLASAMLLLGVHSQDDGAAARTLRVGWGVPLSAQVARPVAPPVNDYVVGPQDALIITSYDQPSLTGRFIVEADGSFTYPLIGRVRAGGLTLRQIEAALKGQLTEEGVFNNPQIAVAIEEYKSQKIFIVGEVRKPGVYPLTGTMRLVEALALAGSTLPTSSGEAVIVQSAAHSGSQHPRDKQENAVRVNLRDLENGVFSQNLALSGGETIFVLRAESVYVFGHVKNPGAYPLQQKDTTVLQALSLAGGLTDRGSTGRILIVRMVNGERQEVKVELIDRVLAGDTIVVPERFF